jgi:hypothetical protein
MVARVWTLKKNDSRKRSGTVTPRVPASASGPHQT